MVSPTAAISTAARTTPTISPLGPVESVTATDVGAGLLKLGGGVGVAGWAVCRGRGVADGRLCLVGLDVGVLDPGEWDRSGEPDGLGVWRWPARVVGAVDGRTAVAIGGWKDMANVGDSDAPSVVEGTSTMPRDSAAAGSRIDMCVCSAS